MVRLARLISIGGLLSLLLQGCSNPEHASQGYIEGQFRYIAANFSGVLQQLYVEKGATVQSGQPLFKLDPQPESDQLKQAENQMLAAQADQQRSFADITLQQLIYKRQESLFRKGVSNQDTLDRSKADLQKAKADFSQKIALLAVAEASLTQAQWAYQQKLIVAPVSGIIFDTYYRGGELITANYPVVSMLAPQDVKVVFYVSEPQLSQIQLGQTIEISCDNCKPIAAKINFISPQAAYTPPVIYSEQIRDKLVFLIEAKPDLADAFKLHPGQPVSVQW
jgi:HlyD family secretion protein